MLSPTLQRFAIEACNFPTFLNNRKRRTDHLPPLAWPMARILELIPGSDGIPRVADLHTATGPVRRSINRLIRLPVPTSFAPEDGDSRDRQERAHSID
ncbi:hypothetical protein AVEN_64299-1 [Araneus ventricosus]|uniref:DUF5641 domain-containing protein n=1 Tax=Araneus ventricosus TaxID=182803 RepID=A0A4Y2NC92_ARAVE|nr:hypothetical protein AVEN_64299-1 [Araneus ventricosus]